MKRPILIVFLFLLGCSLSFTLFRVFRSSASSGSVISAKPESEPIKSGESNWENMAITMIRPAHVRRELDENLSLDSGSTSSAAKTSATMFLSPKPITSSELTTFEVIPFQLGRPAYQGEPVTAYVRVGSLARDLALSVNQGGEFQRVPVRPGETIEVRLAFTRTPPGTKVALTAEDGGGVNIGGSRGRSATGIVDEQQQLGFSYRVTGTAGVHRVTVRVPSGETKVLEFWAGEAPPQKKP